MTDRPQFHVLLSIFLMTRIPPIYNANPRSMAHTGGVIRDFSKTKVKKKKNIFASLVKRIDDDDDVVASFDRPHRR